MKGKLTCLFAVFVFLSFTSVLAKEPEEIWRELGKLSGEERQKFLVSKAKTEGEVAWYTTLSADVLDPLTEGFERRYPGIKTNIWRGRGETVTNRVLIEARAGKFSVDVISGSNENFPVLMKANLVGRYSSPEKGFFYDGSRDQEGYWASVVNVIVAIAYNTQLVPRSEAPRRYEDFLDPKWSGNFAIDTNPDRAVMTWLKVWGSEKTEQFLRGLIKNGAAVRSGHLIIAQLLCAGEFKAAIEVYAFSMVNLKQKGCPVEIVFPDPVAGAVTPLYVAKRSSRPYAAALLVDYLLSEPGQKIVVQKRAFSGRKGINIKHPELDTESKGVQALLLRPEDAGQLGKKYLELRERYLLIR